MYWGREDGESIPRQADKKSGVPQGEVLKEEIGGSKIFKQKERTNFFFSTFLSLSHRKLFSLIPELMITQQTTQFKLCTKDYITTMYPA